MMLDEYHVGAEAHIFMPEQLAHLTFSSGRRWSIGEGGLLTPVPQATLEGLVTTSSHLISEGVTRTLRAELYPWAARQLFGWSYPAAALDLLGGAAGSGAAQTAHEITAALTTCDDETALGLLNDWLLALASGEQRAGGAGREWTAGAGVRAAIELYHRGGQRRLTELAGSLDVSLRTLERQFLHEVGISAKTLARLIRFETAHNLLASAPGTPLAALAYDLGFADQAHLTHEFRILGGVTPGSFIRMIETRHQEVQWLDFRHDNPRLLLPQLP